MAHRLAVIRGTRLGASDVTAPFARGLAAVPTPGRLMVVGVKTAPTVTFTSPVAVPRGFGEANPARPRTFDIMRFDELRAKVPSK